MVDVPHVRLRDNPATVGSLKRISNFVLRNFIIRNDAALEFLHNVFFFQSLFGNKTTSNGRISYTRRISCSLHS